MNLFKNLIFRVVAALTALVMLIGTAAFADESAAEEQQIYKNESLYADNKEAVDLLRYLDILPDSVKNSLSERVTKGEFTYMLVKLCRLDSVTGAVRIFEDVDENNEFFNEIWAGYAAGIVHGASDGRFYPNNLVSYEEAVKMTVSALGYGTMAQNRGGYPMGYINTAQSLDITKYIKNSDKSQMNKAAAVQLLFGALQSDGADITYSDNQAYLAIDGEYTFLNQSYDIYRGTGIVTDTENSLHFADKEDHTGKIGIDGQIVDLADDAIGTDGDILGKSVYYYYRNIEGTNNDEVVLIGERTGRNAVLTICGEDIEDINESRVSYWDEKDSKRTANTANAAVYYNGIRGGNLSNYEIKDDAVLKLIDNNGDRKYEYAFLDVYDRVEVVQTASFGKIEAKFTDWKMTAKESEEVDFYRDGIKIKPNYLGEWDILKFKCGRYGEILSVDVFYNEVTGVVDSVKPSENEAVIDGVTYKISDEYLKAVTDKHYDACEITKNMRATFITDNAGRIYGVNTIQDQDKQYGYLVGMEQTGKGLNPSYQAKLFAMFGKMTYCDMPEKVKFNGKPLTPAEIKTKLTNSAGVFEDQLIMYVLNGKGELTSVDTAVDATASGTDVDNFSKDFAFKWDGVSAQKNWSYDNNIRIIGESGGYHVPAAGTVVPAFYIPNDLNEDTYFKYSDAVTGLSSYAKDTDYYLYDAGLYTDQYDLKYVKAIVIKERSTTTASSGTTGPYVANSVTSGNYKYLILVDNIAEEADENGEVHKILYGKAINNSYTLEFKGMFADKVWNADRENVFKYGNLSVDDIEQGDVIMISYSNANDAELLIDRFIIHLKEDDAREGNIFASYFTSGSNTSLSSSNPYFVFGEIVICRNNQMIIKTKDYKGDDLYLSTTLDIKDSGKLVYNMKTGEMDSAKIEMFTTGSRIAFMYNSSKISQIILYTGE